MTIESEETSLRRLVGYVPVVSVIALLSIRLFSTFAPAFMLAIGWMIFLFEERIVNDDDFCKKRSGPRSVCYSAGKNPSKVGHPPLATNRACIMCTGIVQKIVAFVFVASTLAFAQQAASPSSSTPTNAPAQEQPTNPGLPATTESSGREPSVHQANEPRQSSSPTSKVLQPKKRAWQILNTACTGDRPGARATAIRVLGLLPNDAKAARLAEAALIDEKGEVRAAAAAALGDMKSKASIPSLRKALDDGDPSVALAAAHSLETMHDDFAYDVYYEVLTGQRKAGKGMIASQASIFKDKKKMAQLGFEEGIGFIPFAGIGWEAIKVIRKDDSSPVRAAAAKVLARDPDPDATKALIDAVSDKSWLVRAASLEALAKRGDPSALDTVQLSMFDDKEAVRFTAAAAVLRLTAIKASGHSISTRNNKTGN
jgi:HEAT repeat protein